ncbi:MAG: hypothetical protein JWO56_217 [Acidobacteria bacterium]|nr:hypothetical protein [Acidobacteriota bacterium]
MPSRSRCLLLLAIALSAAPLLGDCIDNGHYTVVAVPDPMTGTRFPYTEDLVHHVTDAPVGDELTVAYHDDLRWTKIQSGCASFGEYNVSASTPVNLLLRASMRLAYMETPTAPPETRYEVQLRVGESAGDPHPRIAATETRRLGGRYPRTERFAATLQDLPAGNYVYSFWFRLLDGPAGNHVTLQLQWISAQGAPNIYPSERQVAAADDLVTAEWKPVGIALPFRSRRAMDAVMQSSFVVAEAPEGASLTFGWSLDEGDSGDRLGTIATPAYLPSSELAIDNIPHVPPGEHTLQLYARSAGGAVRLQRVVTEMIAFPVDMTRPLIPPMAEEIRVDPMVVTTEGSPEQPVSMSVVCGRWTKILELDLAPSPGNFSWTLNGYVEVLGGEGRGYAQLGIQAEHQETTRDDPEHYFNANTDMGMFEVQVRPGHDGIFFFGDCSKWGNGHVGNHVSLWLRRIEGCNDAQFGGTIVVGRRWLGMKLLPSEGPHLP